MSSSPATSAVASSPADAGTGLRVALWGAQGLLAAAFLGAGVTKLTTPLEQLAAQMAWVHGAMGPAVRFIGLVEVSGPSGCCSRRSRASPRSSRPSRRWASRR